MHGVESEVAGFGPLDMPDNPFDERRIHTFPIASPRKYCYSPPFRAWLRANLSRFDGVVLHGLWVYPNWAVHRECLAQNVPYACFPHGMLAPWLTYGSQLWKTLQKEVCWILRERKILQSARFLFFTTRQEQSDAEAIFHFKVNSRIIPPYGVEFSLDKTLTPPDSKLCLPSEWRIALFLGRIHPKKNLDFLIRAWRAADLPESWHLVIAGSGDVAYENRLKSLVSKFSLSRQVHFVGFVSGRDKSYLLQRAAWFLLPSQRENFGVAVLESIGHGCPVAISNQVYVSEAMHSKSEVLPLEPSSWSTFMRERMVDDGWRDRLARLDAEVVQENLSMETVTRKWASALTEAFS
jgi:glycosyltransferase involved in cell wall biosynthesis